MSHYPQEAPIDDLLKIIDMIVSKNFDKQRFAHSLHNIVGYTLFKIFGEPPEDELILQRINDRPRLKKLLELLLKILPLVLDE